MAGLDPLDLDAAARLARLDPETAERLLAHARGLQRRGKIESRNAALRAIRAELMREAPASAAAREIIEAVRYRRHGELLTRLEAALGDELAELPGHRVLRRILGEELAVNSVCDGQSLSAACPSRGL